MVWPENTALLKAGQLRKRIDPQSHLKLISINFGVGGNPRKLVEGAFETELVLALLNESNARIILDPGAFYILVSREAVNVPPDTAAEMLEPIAVLEAGWATTASETSSATGAAFHRLEVLLS